MITAFPKIFHLGDKNTARIFNGPVEITEKVDGSQFSFGKVKDHLYIRSKKAFISPETVDNMFANGVDFVNSIEDKLEEGLIFHGEYLRVPRHNALEYERIPKNHFMLFAIKDLQNNFVSDHDSLCEWANKLGCEPIPLMFNGQIERKDALEFVQCLLESTSVLGKAKIEGVVVKNYAEQVLIGGQLIPILSGKFVSEEFKEVHKTSWSKHNPGTLEKISMEFQTDARWKKAVQALKESGELESTPRDIGPLLKHINMDIIEEEQDYIKERLWELFKKDILRTATKGFPEWYKEMLLTETFNEQNDEETKPVC